jgi:hypothetical protein
VACHAIKQSERRFRCSSAQPRARSSTPVWLTEGAHLALTSSHQKRQKVDLQQAELSTSASTQNGRFPGRRVCGRCKTAQWAAASPPIDLRVRLESLRSVIGVNPWEP